MAAMVRARPLTDTYTGFVRYNIPKLKGTRSNKSGGQTVMEYKGYFGRVRFDEQFGSFHGEVADIRDVITFPKNQKARDLMTGAPAPVDAKQLKELGL